MGSGLVAGSTMSVLQSCAMTAGTYTTAAGIGGGVGGVGGADPRHGGEVGQAAQPDEPLDGQRPVQQLPLWDIGDSPRQIGARHRGGIDAIDTDFPGRGNQREDRPRQRRFASAIRTDDGGQRAGSEGGRHVADDGAAAEGDADMVKDKAHHSRRSRIRWTRKTGTPRKAVTTPSFSSLVDGMIR
eukprot:gene14772-18877_t